MDALERNSPPGHRRPKATQESIPYVAIDDLAMLSKAVLIDLRSPKEYEEDHLPDALNIPLFDDLERELIGTLYAKESPENAFDEGHRRTRARIASLVTEIGAAAGWAPPTGALEGLVDRFCAGGLAGMQSALELVEAPLPARPVVLYCWRGGMRSRSVTALVRCLGLQDAVLLEGGYKSYRRFVLDRFDRFQVPPAFVLRGLTGVGKTLVLRAMECDHPGWTVDLEGAAGHRSSILGMVGLTPVSQKRFDSQLSARLAQGFPQDLMVLEGESRKVGDSIVPASIWKALRAGTPLELTAPMPRRVQVLIEDYLSEKSSREELARQLPFIEERLGSNKWRGVLVGLLEAGREAELVEVLLERYYDPLYLHSEKRFLTERSAAGLSGYVERFDVSDVQEAAQGIARWILSYQ